MANIYGTIYDDNSTVGPNGKFNIALFGTSENDYIFGDEGNDAMYGFSGVDVIIGGLGNDAVVGYQNNDWLFGGDGDDDLGEWYHGEPGSDYLHGGEGKDILHGYGRNSEGAEYDTLIGGGGADIFALGHETTDEAYYLGDGYATIVDFTWSEGDKIKVFGSIEDYSLDQSYNWTGDSALDTAIYYKGDLIGIVQDKSGSQVLLTEDFNFVT